MNGLPGIVDLKYGFGFDNVAGGATALIAASASNPLPRASGYSIVLVVFVDSVIMLVIGLLVNNAQPHKRYPTFWF